MTNGQQPQTSAGRSRVVRWLKYEWHTPVAIVGGVVSSLSSLVAGSGRTGLLVAGVVLIAAGTAGTAVNHKRVSGLKDRCEMAESDRDAARDSLTALAQLSTAVYRSLLVSIARELELTNQERISIYVHDPRLSSFQLLSRHAPDPTLEGAVGRRVYPDTQGIIGGAWRAG